jgi:hypothetical protein
MNTLGMLPLLGFAVWRQNAQTPRFAAEPSAIPGVVVEGPDDGAYAGNIDAILGPEQSSSCRSGCFPRSTRGWAPR